MSKNNNCTSNEGNDDNNSFYNALHLRATDSNRRVMDLFYGLTESDDIPLITDSNNTNSPSALTLTSRNDVRKLKASNNDGKLCADVSDAEKVEEDPEENQIMDLELAKAITKVDICPFCNEKWYFYDLFLLRNAPPENSNQKICIYCALKNVDDKRKIIDVEFKCDRKLMIQPTMCSKCHAVRSVFRFKRKQSGKKQYCCFCAKKRYFTLHKQNPHTNRKYISPLMLQYGDPKSHN